jgi:hypothetical protein
MSSATMADGNAALRACGNIAACSVAARVAPTRGDIASHSAIARVVVSSQQ